MPRGLNESYYQYNSVETALHLIKSYLTLDPSISVNCDRMFGVLGFSGNIVKYSPK